MRRSVAVVVGIALGAALAAAGTWLYVGHVLVLATGALALTGALLGLVQSAKTAIVERIAPARGGRSAERPSVLPSSRRRLR